MITPGFILIDKPAGISSAQVVAQIKRSFQLSRKVRVGHAGTLDPDATGLLICPIGRATKLVPLLGGGIKEYVGELQLGIRTSTDDLAGEVLEEFRGILPSAEQVVRASKVFVGQIDQTPPLISAVKVAGERAYKRARRGEDFQLQSRSVRVEVFELSPVSSGTYRYRIVCSPGTYIRSLARDLGMKLGVGGAVASLRRTRSFPFSVDEAVPLPCISADLILPWEEAFKSLPTITISERNYGKLLNGNLSACAEELGACRFDLDSGSDDQARILARFQRARDGVCGGLLSYSNGKWEIEFLDVDQSEAGNEDKRSRRPHEEYV